MSLKLKQLFDEQHEILAWCVFLVATIHAVLKGIDGWTVALFIVSLVTARAVRVKHAGPSGVTFGDECPVEREE